MEGQKLCPKMKNGCGQLKAFSAFSKDNRRHDKLCYYCKDCVREMNAARYLADPKIARQRAAAWRSKNPARVAGLTRTFCARFHKLKPRIRKKGGGMTKQQYLELIGANECHYCGDSLPPAGFGLDRKDNDLGYTFENCVPCCIGCNSAKGANFYTYEEMVSVIGPARRLVLAARARIRQVEVVDGERI